jgi:hypothetical protein
VDDDNSAAAGLVRYAVHLAGFGWLWGEVKESSFSEEKQAKRLLFLGAGDPARSGPPGNQVKVVLLLISEKKCL